MDKLAPELLSLIFSYLHREQKLQCRLVCRSFANALRNGHDLETVVMSCWPSSDHYGEAFTNLVKHVRADPATGKKCKRLVLDGQLNSGYNKSELGELFPNLSCLFLGTGGLITLMNQAKHSPKNAMIGSDPLQHWRENLEMLLVESDSRFYSGLFVGDVFKNLTTLVLGAENEYRTTGFSAVFTSFQNTPALKNLVIASNSIRLNELEKLHKNAPNLESLVLLHAGFKDAHKDRQVNQPANSLKKLVIKSQLVHFSISENLTKYMVQKYPNIQHFSLLLNEKLPQLSIEPNVNLESSLCNLLSQFGPKLESVKLRLPFSPSNAIDTLTKYTVQVQELEANACFGKTKLYKILSYAKDFNLQALHLTQLPSFQFSVLKGINGLKSLGLVFKDKNKNKESINLNSLLRQVTSSIESLEIGNATVNVNSKKGNPSNIRTLIFKKSVVPTEMQHFLTENCHQLKSLTLYRCHVGPVFELPSHHLSYFAIDIIRQCEPFYIRTINELEKYKHKVTHLQVTLGDTTCHYRFPSDQSTENNPLLTHEYFDKHDHAIRLVCRPTKYEDGLSYFQFKCASAQTIFYNGYLAL